MISLAEVKQKAARKNDQQNKKLHFFASKFSIYFSWVFINLGLNANQVTGIFFVTGLIGAFSFLGQSPLWALLGYALWRLHIIFDLCDGDVARFTQKFSINGAYWDYMIHSILFPLAYVCICISLFNKFGNEVFIYIAAFGSIVVSQMLSVKNNYYRAMLFNSRSLDVSVSQKSDQSLKYSAKDIILYVVSFDGFLFCYLLMNFVGFEDPYYLGLLAIYSAAFAASSLLKFWLFSKDGFYERRS